MNSHSLTVTSNSNKIAFSIQNYMVSLILPKCVMVHGEIISSVYLQIAININHKKSSLHWQKNNCWMQPNRIAENIGYNIRTVYNSLKLLEDLNLIKTKKQGKLNIYTLQNNSIQSIVELVNFNNNIETTLLRDLNKTKTQKYQELFNKLNLLIGFKENFNYEYLIKSIWFSDISLLRKMVMEAENIYKGSSLFFVSNIAQNYFKYDSNTEFNTLSEQDRAIKVGSSQSTISRYINSYIKSNCILVIEGDINKPSKLECNPHFFEENFEKRVVNIVEDGKKLICPICSREFTENKSLSLHIAKAKDKHHSLLNELKKQNKCEIEKINDLYLSHKGEFDELDNTLRANNQENLNDSYLNIPCDCKMSCKECYRDWKLDFYNDCDHERKVAFINEFSINEKEQRKMVKTASKKEAKIEEVDITVSKDDFNIVKPVKSKVNTNSAPGLVKYFYSLTGGTSPNWAKECGQVKNLLTKGTSVDDIKTTMEFLNRKGQIDLRFLNRSINEAILEKQYLAQTSEEGTEAFLVKMYYDGLGLPLNIQTLVRDVQKIKETINTGLSYEQVKIVVQYMVEIKCPTLNFIGSKRTEALTKMTKVNAAKNNPSFFDRDDLVIIQNELINGRTTLGKISDQFKPEARSIALKLFKENSFSDKYTHFEWAWKIGLDLDKEMYQIALNSLNSKEFTLDKILKDPNITEEQKSVVAKIKDKFTRWLNEQAQQFATAQSND